MNVSALDPFIAVCIANNRELRNTLSFRMTNYTPPFRASCYFIDYNTSRRNQRVSMTVGDYTSEEHHLVGESFHCGQWVTWEIYELPANDIITINILIMPIPLGTSDFRPPPNWVISAMMIDPMIDNMHDDNVPIKLSNVDDETRGEWMGRYGNFGGIIFDSTPIVVSSRKEEHVIDILFLINKEEKKLMNDTWIYGYDWVKAGRGLRKGAMDNPHYEYGLNVKG